MIDVVLLGPYYYYISVVCALCCVGHIHVGVSVRIILSYTLYMALRVDFVNKSDSVW